MVVDDKPHVWGTDAPHVLRVEPFTYYPEQAARQTGINVEEAVLAEQELDRVRETITKTRCDFYEVRTAYSAGVLTLRVHNAASAPQGAVHNAVLECARCLTMHGPIHVCDNATHVTRYALHTVSQRVQTANYAL